METTRNIMRKFYPVLDQSQLKMEGGKTGNRKINANELRLEAIRRKARESEEAQNTIKIALQHLDRKQNNSTHITFSDSDSEDAGKIECSESAKNLDTKKSSSDKLFGFSSGSEASDDEEIRIKPQFQGKDGEKLLELQSRYGNDARFRLDNRFAESDNESESFEDEEHINNDVQVSVNGNNTDLKDEMSRNMEMIAKVVGSKVKLKDASKKKTSNFIDASSRRYDPTKGGDLEVKVTKESVKAKAKKKKKLREELPEVDSKRFYQTSAVALKDAFGDKAEEKECEVKEFAISNDKTSETSKPFSILSMLGRKEDSDSESETSETEEDMETRHALVEDSRSTLKMSKERKKIPTLKRPFQYDSSETDEEDEDDVASEQIDAKRDSVKETSKEEENISKKLFMISPDDPRLITGVEEFCWNKSFEEMQKEWLEVKDNLIQDYKKKHRDAKKKAKIEAKQLKFGGVS